MNSQEFILWLKGFVDAVNGIPTQNQWETLKEKLAEVKDPIPSEFSITPAKEGFGYYYVSSTNSINPKKEILND
jgi:hypothetical protein